VRGEAKFSIPVPRETDLPVGELVFWYGMPRTTWGTWSPRVVHDSPHRAYLLATGLPVGLHFPSDQKLIADLFLFVFVGFLS